MSIPREVFDSGNLDNLAAWQQAAYRIIKGGIYQLAALKEALDIDSLPISDLRKTVIWDSVLRQWMSVVQ